MIKLVQTCIACPEQYDAYHDGENVAYLRLRHGSFTVDVPFGRTVYRANPEGDGIFEFDERDRYLTEAVKAIMDELGVEGDPEYEIVDEAESEATSSP